MRQRPNGPGRPPFEPTPAMLDKFRRAGAIGLNLSQSCIYVGIGYSTFADRRKQYPQILEAWELGRQETASKVAEALLLNALTPTESAPAGNVTAQKAILRQVGDWRDKTEVSGPADAYGSAPPLQVVITLPDNGRRSEAAEADQDIEIEAAEPSADSKADEDADDSED